MGLWTWLKGLFVSKTNRSKRATIHLDLDRQELELYKAWAQSRGVRLEDWIKGLLGQAIPRQVREDSVRKNTNALAVLNRAYDVLDDEDAAVLGLPPPSQQEVPVSDQPKDSNPQRLPIVENQNAHMIGHPCRSLLREFQPPFTERDSQGKCQKLNKVCFWSAQAARQCLDFQPKMLLRQPPSGPR